MVWGRGWGDLSGVDRGQLSPGGGDQPSRVGWNLCQRMNKQVVALGGISVELTAVNFSERAQWTVKDSLTL